MSGNHINISKSMKVQQSFLNGRFFHIVQVFVLVVLTLSLLFSTAAAYPDKQIREEHHNPKIETNLELIASRVKAGQISKAREAAEITGILSDDSYSIEVIVEEKKGQYVNSSQIRRAGGKIIGRTGNLLKVRISPKNLQRMANEIPGVRYIRTPLTPVPLNYQTEKNKENFTTVGVTLTGGSVYHSKDFMGEGTNIAVIDVGFGSYQLAQDAGELPEEVVAETKDYTGAGAFTGDAHGTGVAEIVHDMAPQAQLYLKRIDDEINLAEAVEDAVAQDIDIIVHSVGWMNTNFGDGTGVIADIARSAASNGILWVNAAGNAARKHWEGMAADRDGDSWLEFEGSDESISLDVTGYATIQVCLTWNDWPQSDIDFDLFLYDHLGNLVTSSQNYQTGNESPTETITYTPIDSGEYYLKVSRAESNSNEDVEIEIFSTNYSIDPYVEAGSIMAPGNAAEVFAVGAINKNQWKDGPIEPFSSRGPTNDGRIKPDLTGIDGFTLYTYSSFLGTSASAPVVAGAASLLLSRTPDLELEELKAALAQHAQDLGPSGLDNTYGAGKLRLIYESTSASRAVETTHGSISPGDTFTVTLTGKMPLTLKGGISIEENLPEPLEISEVNSSGSVIEQTDREVQFEWPIVSSGTSVQASYTVSVPEDTSPEEYEITGTVNGQSIEPSTVSVSSTTNLSRDALQLQSTAAGMSGENWVKFLAKGENISQIKVAVYNLSGNEVYNSEWRDGNTLQWNLQDDEGKPVGNGIYLYFVTVKDIDGDTIRGELEKTLVLR